MNSSRLLGRPEARPAHTSWILFSYRFQASESEHPVVLQHQAQGLQLLPEKTRCEKRRGAAIDDDAVHEQRPRPRPDPELVVLSVARHPTPWPWVSQAPKRDLAREANLPTSWLQIAFRQEIFLFCPSSRSQPLSPFAALSPPALSLLHLPQHAHHHESSKQKNMWSTAREIAAGDTVIAWMTRDLIQPLVITPGKDLNSKYGYYRHDDLIGIPYGSKVRSRNGKGFIHLLRPTPELWTLALPHRTQILYLADIAFVTSCLNISPGSKVIEAGTGSGSFSHSVARTVGPDGHLWSYEFHEARANKAREEFARHGVEDIVTLTHRNVCKEGFTVADTVDAVFLDLPAPWEAVEHAKKALPLEEEQEQEQEQEQQDAAPAKITLSKAFPEVRGHTSYLTFAVLLPASVIAQARESAAEAWAEQQQQRRQPSTSLSSDTTEDVKMTDAGSAEPSV
ncbi:hypothetical protein BN946_scf184915.g12 [Trametes cinnabarina]|uniref:tRNA (adenine(58)-N(1))-methyltransferase catalytic subunit TRM61 n=1 Tax=Pycnoporus cinnabarinus TaxID=5643 RepID=A0A060SGX5_PYCCI|nr:hypothetical protein BN946_scf184915.g12 [Trametes cinnabarina]